VWTADEAHRVLESLEQVQWDGNQELGDTEQQFFTSLDMLK
jgi:hypothetical protein